MTKSIEKLVIDYKTNAERHGVATVNGDFKLANNSYSKLIKVLHEIRKFGNYGDEALLTLTEDINESVKCWAATHSLKYNKDRAEKVLFELSKKGGPVAFDAEMVLSEWKKGTLNTP